MNILGIQDVPFHQVPFRSSGRKEETSESIVPFYKVLVDSLPDGITSFALTSDLQGRECDTKNRLLGEAVAEALVNLVEKGDLQKIDIMLLAGDFYDYPDLRKLGGTGDVTSVLNTFAHYFPKVISVYGNHDIVIKNELFSNVTILDGDTTSCNEIVIGGVSGIVGSPNKNHRKTEIDYEKCLDKVLVRKPDIILLHEGPDDPVNGQRGNPMIRNKIQNNMNSLILFGHSFWQKRYIKIGNNHLLNTNRCVYVFVQDH